MAKIRIKFLPTTGFLSNSSIHHSVSGIKSAFSRKEFENVVPTSRRSYAASVDSALPYREKDGKRIPVQARRAIVQSFVDEYKALNAGKFPSASQTMKQVGGSYYVVKKILQELQSESTISSLKSRSKLLFEETTIKENPNVDGKHSEVASDPQKSFCAKKILSDAVEIATSFDHPVLPMNSNLSVDSEEVVSSRTKPDGDDKALGRTSEHAYTENHVLNNERDLISDSSHESRFSSEELKHEEDPNCKEQQVHNSFEFDRMNMKNRRVDVTELPTSESTAWGGRIKSIVDGIINMWRKL